MLRLERADVEVAYRALVGLGNVVSQVIWRYLASAHFSATGIVVRCQRAIDFPRNGYSWHPQDDCHCATCRIQGREDQ